MATDPTRILARVFEMTGSLAAQADMETCLQSLLSAAMEVTESEISAILEYEENTQELVFRHVPWFQREALLNARASLSGSAPGWVFSRNQPLLVNEVKPEARPQMGIPAALDVRSVLGVPLSIRGKNLGVLLVLNKKSPYTQPDGAALQSLAVMAAALIQNNALEAHIQSTQNESRHLDRLKNEFIAITSHELRTPLGVILGHSTFLRELVQGEYQEQVDTIIRSASKLKEIIESLSSMDNQQTGNAILRAHKISMTQIITDVILSFQEMAKQKGVSIQAENAPGEFLLEGDGGKLGIALSNLIKNAITFTNQGGVIKVRSEGAPGFIKITVEDNGVGIPEKDQTHIFERFYQVESHLTRRHGGMGLGLSVAKAMIEMHNGRIWVESQEGVGSKFIFTLPA